MFARAFVKKLLEIKLIQFSTFEGTFCSFRSKDPMKPISQSKIWDN